MIEQIEHLLRRPEQSRPLRRDDDRPVDQDRVRQHEIDQFVVAPSGIGEVEFGLGRAFLAQQFPNGNRHGLN
jgi:hypothetical protein